MFFLSDTKSKIWRRKKIERFYKGAFKCIITEVFDLTWSSISFRTDSHMIWRHLMTFPRSNLPLKSCKRVSRKSKRGEIASTVGKDSGDQAKWKMCFFIPPWSWKWNENWILDRFLKVEEALWSAVFAYG